MLLVGQKMNLCCGNEFLLSWRLVAGFSPCWPVFDPGPVRAWFLVDKLTVGQVLLGVLRFFPCQYHRTIAPFSRLSTRYTYEVKRAKAGHLQNAVLCRKMWALDRKVLSCKGSEEAEFRAAGGQGG